MNLTIATLKEPKLEFGNAVTGEDPKVYMPISGPLLCKRDTPAKDIHLGLVALPDQIEPILSWFEKMDRMIVSPESNAKRFLEFPGSGKAVKARFIVDKRFIARLDSNKFALALAKSGSEQFGDLLKLYGDAIGSLFVDGGPACILVCFPEDVAALRLENFALSYEQRRKLERLKQREESNQLEFFEPDPQELKSAAELLPQADELLFRNFHRALKARCMMQPNAVPIQVIRRHTYAQDEKDVKQSEATRAWNLAVALYYKAGNIPWRPADLQANTCFVGISFHHLKTRAGNLIYSSLAHAFSNDLEPFTLKGASIPHNQIRNKQPYLKPDQASEMMQRVVDNYESKTGTKPTRLVVHKTSRYQPEEEEGFRINAQADIAEIDLVWLASTGFRLLRRGMKEPLRGTLCSVGEDRNFLFTTGYIPSWEEYPGPHIPSPLEVGSSGRTNMEDRAREILTLTKMNWNSADGIGRMPITLSFARRVGMVMTEMDDNAVPNPSYRFYM